MKTKRNITIALTILMTLSMLTLASAQSSKMPTDPIGGQPPAGSKPSAKDLDYQLKYQLGIEIAFPQQDVHLRTLPEEMVIAAAINQSNEESVRES